MARSVPGQHEPYPTLADVVANQTLLPYEKVKGTLIGIWSPPSVGVTSSTGFHFHLISDDRTKGGHVLDVQVTDVSAQLDGTARLVMDLPSSS